MKNLILNLKKSNIFELKDLIIYVMNKIFLIFRFLFFLLISKNSINEEKEKNEFEIEY